MQIIVNRRFSDNSSYIYNNQEEIQYRFAPNTEVVDIPANPETPTFLMPYYSYAPSVEYFLVFSIKNIAQFLETEYRRLLFFRRTAGLLLPIGEVFYHYKHTKNFSYSNILQNISSMYVDNKLVVILNTKANPYIPKNDEALLVHSTHSLNLVYKHSAEKEFYSRRTNFFVRGNRQFDGSNCGDANIDDVLKNYSEVKILDNKY